jgi:hypothetical protein
LRFCTECSVFPCYRLVKSVGVHPEWLKEQAALTPHDEVTHTKRKEYPGLHGHIAIY